MKRILSFLIVLVLILGGYSGIAEMFSVRNGIEFGMSKDEVIRIETEVNGLKYTGDDSETDESYDLWDGEHINGRVVFDCKSLAGYDNADNIQYYFDESDSLNRIVYLWLGQTKPENYTPSLFSSLKPSDEMLKQYRDLTGSLSEKYELIGDMEGGEINSVDFGNPRYIDIFWNDDDGWYQLDMRDFSQYLYSYEDGYVSISAYCTSKIQNVAGFSWDFVIFEYTYCSPEQVEAKLAEGQAKIDERNNDL